jgi:hypothetical protein
MARTPKTIAALKTWIHASAAACAEAQARLDQHLLHHPAAEARRELSQAGIQDLLPPRSRQVIQRMEMNLRVRWVRSETIGFRIDAGWRWQDRSSGLTHERRTTERRSEDASVTIHVEPVPLYLPSQSRTSPDAGPKDLQENPTSSVP